MPDRVPEHHLVSVFEAANLARRELYVGATVLLPSQLDAAFPAKKPALAAHWGDDAVQLRVLVYSVPKSKAREAIAAYAPSPERAGWRVLRQVLRDSA